jgi:hypothetical protein
VMQDLLDDYSSHDSADAELLGKRLGNFLFGNIEALLE